jgi:hypothetical protein
MQIVSREAHVTLSGDISGEYIVEDRQPDGRLVLKPDTSWAAILQRSGARELTDTEFQEFVGKYEPFLLPDGEG